MSSCLDALGCCHVIGGLDFYIFIITFNMDIKVSTRTDLHTLQHHYIIFSNCEVKEFMLMNMAFTVINTYTGRLVRPVLQLLLFINELFALQNFKKEFRQKECES